MSERMYKAYDAQLREANRAQQNARYYEEQMLLLQKVLDFPGAIRDKDYFGRENIVSSVEKTIAHLRKKINEKHASTNKKDNNT